MDQELVEKVTKMIISRLEEQPEKNTSSAEIGSRESSVKIWPHTGASSSVTEIKKSASDRRNVNGKAVFSPFTSKQTSKKRKSSSDTPRAGKRENTSFSRNDQQSDSSELLKRLRKQTPARIGVGRSGARPKTETWLKFRYDHAAARDAVSGEVDSGVLESINLFSVKTKVKDNEIYIRRPDYGRRLSDEAKTKIKEKCKMEPDVQIIVSDGLSSSAIEENIEDVYLSLEQSLKRLNLTAGTPFYIERGRVAVMDDVGELLKPKVIILLIGERPGLGSAESMSAYMCYEPRLGTIEADRMVVSNIHKGGVPPVEAGAYLGTVVEKILKYQASGVSLVQKEK